MAAINGLSVVSAVSRKIRDSIPTTELKNIYKDRPKQSLQKPYAFIHQIEAEHRPALKLSGERHYTVDIRCHPDDNQTDINSWAYTLSEKIISAVKNIYLLDGNQYPIRANKFSWRVEQEVLHVIVNYSFRVVAIEEEPIMNNLNYGERVK